MACSFRKGYPILFNTTFKAYKLFLSLDRLWYQGCRKLLYLDHVERAIKIDTKAIFTFTAFLCKQHNTTSKKG